MVAARRLARSSALALLIAASPALAQHASTTDAYRAQAMAELERLKADAPVVGKARNIILFIGDGMGVSTLTAARIHQGQRQGVDGESFVPPWIGCPAQRWSKPIRMTGRCRIPRRPPRRS